MTTSDAEGPSTKIIFSHEYIVNDDCEIEMQCHDRHFRDTVFLDLFGSRIFALDVPGLFTSWSMRRTLVDATGAPLVEIRHVGKLSLEKWTIEDASDRQLCSVKGSKSRTSGATVIEADLKTESASGATITLQSADHAGTTTMFLIDGEPIAEMALVQNNDLSFLGRRGLDRSAWKLKVLKGNDLALIAALAVCRAEVLHAWRR